MPTPYYLNGMTEYNRLLAACGCCPAPDCGDLGFEAHNRAVEIRFCGFAPHQKYDWHPDDGQDTDTVECSSGFDFGQTPPVRIPLYKKRTTTVKHTWDHDAENQVIYYKADTTEDYRETWSANTSYVETLTTVEEFGIDPTTVSGSNIPAARCGPDVSDTPLGAPTGLGVTEGTPSGGLVEITPTWTEGDEPDHGQYEVEVDGTEDSPIPFDLSEDDETCHFFRVRHSMTGRNGDKVFGAWSAYFAFTLKDAPECCDAPEHDGCTLVEAPESTDNTAASRLTWDYTTTETGGTNSSGDECDVLGSNPIGYAFTGLDVALGRALTTDPDDPADPPESNPIADVETCSDTTTTVKRVGTEDWVNPGELPSSYPGNRGSFSSVGSYEKLTTITLSVDINTSTTDTDTFDDARAELNTYHSTWAWTEGTPAARWDLTYPETPQFPFSTGYVSGTITEARFRWTVLASYTGNWWKVIWDVYFFPDGWVEWRAEYFQWALDKWAHESWVDDPEDPDDERPPDPGTAPTEPTAGPTMLSEDNEWEWTGPGTQRADETFQDCDPTADLRALECDAEQATLDAVPAGSEHDDAREAAQAALDACEDEIDAIRELTARQSDWYLLTIATKPASNGSVVPTNVRYFCTTNPIHGEIPTYDLTFPTTELPTLDPTERDPSEWSDWF